MQNFFPSTGGRGGGGREGEGGKQGIFWGNRKSASGELLNKIVVTEGSLGTSF